jgi:nickel-dependent lactate racemase
MQPEFITFRSGNLTATVRGDSVQLLSSSRVTSQSVADQCRHALASPLGLPELARCVVPGDIVAIVVDPETPGAIELLGAVCEQLQSVPENNLTLSLLLPPDLVNSVSSHFIDQLPLHLRQQLTIHVHDPGETAQLSYLATSAAGERVYLNRRVADADLLVTIGMVCFDSLLGYRGTTSGIFPAFSDTETIQQARTQGHPELTPEQPRPYRQLIDEVGWLLGTQFSLQIVPGPGENPLAVLAGLPDDVMTAGKELVDHAWRLKPRKQVEALLLSVPCGNTASGWKQFGKAIELATKLVQPDGRIIVIADLAVPEGPGATMLRRSPEPEELLTSLRREPGEDSVEMSQLINALRHARVYLYSNISTDVVEELGMIAIEGESELQRLTTAAQSCAVLPNANYAWIR